MAASRRRAFPRSVVISRYASCTGKRERVYSRRRPGVVLPHPPRNVGGHTGVERAIGTAQDVNRPVRALGDWWSFLMFVHSSVGEFPGS